MPFRPWAKFHRPADQCHRHALDFGHKLHAPKGIGILYVRKGTKFSPFLIGGHQEKGRRGGTENTPSIIGLGKACELAARNLDQENTRVKQLRDRLESELLQRIPTAESTETGGAFAQHSNISFEFVEGESILLMLNEYGICASSVPPAHRGPCSLHTCCGPWGSLHHGACSIRFSLSIYNTDEEIDL